MTTPSLQVPSESTTAAWMSRLVADIEATYPVRPPGSPGERGAHELLASELNARGLVASLVPFRYSPNLYAVLALHYAVALVGSLLFLWQPLVAAVLHGLAATSYFLDSHYCGFWLRRCLPYCASQNVVARQPAAGAVRRRVVLIAHADAAPTGWMFEPRFLRWALPRCPNWLVGLKKQMLLWTVSLAILIVLDVLYATAGYVRPGLYVGMTLGSLVPLILTLQIVLKNRIVAGANDNLTGCAAVVALAERLQRKVPADAEIVYVITGCEEAGRGGSCALLAEHARVWTPADTVFIGLDTLSGGTLRYHVEGELVPCWPSRRFLNIAHEVAERDERFRSLAYYHAPAGATDTAPFIWHGFEGLCLVRINPRTDIPSNYHIPADNHANVDFDDVSDVVDYAEALTLELCRRW